MRIISLLTAFSAAFVDDIEFLKKLGAIGIGEDGKRHPTAAGLLMFGFEYEIMQEYPQYFLDYQETFEPHNKEQRWTDRIVSSSGEWSGNVLDFFYKVYNKLIQNPQIKIPFKIAYRYIALYLNIIAFYVIIKRN
jgi:hypothetical protein